MKALRLALPATILMLALSLSAYASVEFFPLSHVKAGMKCIGKTVIRGTTIETFNVEILDIIPDGGFDGSAIILAKFSGPVIDSSNGIAEGYSGSPVYINGKLLGAVSSAIPFSDTHVGGITPIANMLAALPNRFRGDYSSNTVVPEPNVKRKLKFTENLKAAEKSNEQQPLEGGTLSAVPISAPIVVSGLSANSMRILEEKIANSPFLHLAPIGGAGDGVGGLRKGLLYSPAADGPLQAGDAAGVSLMTGDIDISAIGTVTYVDDNGQVLMFGHPFNMTGEIDLPLQKAYIAYTYKSIERAFKVGYTLYPVGAAKQDRAAAVGGLLNAVPDMVPMKITIRDIDMGITREFNVSIARDPSWFDSLAMTAFGEALVRTVNMQRGGTVRMEFALEGSGLKEPLKRTNYYYSNLSPTDVVWEEMLPLASLLANNIYREVKLTKLSVSVDFTRNRVNAAIDGAELLLPGEKPKKPLLAGEPAQADAAGDEVESQPEGEDGAGSSTTQLQQQNRTAQDSAVAEAATPLSPALPQPRTVRPGQLLRVVVRLQPYREKPIEQMIYFTLPADFPEGPTSMVVHSGGGLLSIFNEFGGRGRYLLGMGNFVNVPVNLHDLDKIIEKALSTPLNNDIVVSILKPGVDPSAGQNAQPAKAAEDPDWEPDFRVSLPTKWVIYEGQMIPIIVAKAGSEADNQPATRAEADEVEGEGDGEG